MQDPNGVAPNSLYAPPPVEGAQFNSQAVSIDSMLQNSIPTAPTLLYTQNDGGTFGLPVKQVRIKSDFHIGTMFGSMSIVYSNNTGKRITGFFAFPGEQTVTDVNIKIGKGRYMATTYISNDDAQKNLSGGKNRNSGVADDPNGRFIPGLFRCPVNNINPNDDVIIDIQWMQPVEFIEGRYQYQLPLTFGPNILPVGVPLHQVIYIEATINCLTPGIRYGSASHSLILGSHENGLTHIAAAPLPQNTTSTNFHLAYSVESNVVSSVTLVEPPNPNSWDQRGSFVTFVNPPVKPEAFTARDIIFLIDRSGSMSGQPWTNAAQALQHAMNTLQEQDRFGIVCFDHEACFFGGSAAVGIPNQPPQFALYGANQQNIQNATQFVMGCPARGGTNIRTPLLWALETLHMNADPRRVPFVVLLTDGAVRDEKEIVKSVKQQSENGQNVRVLTFGIGQHCNWYFLKMLSLSTRGWSSGALSPEKLVPKMNALIERASQPVLLAPSLQIDGLSSCQLVPSTIPDLFVGGPLVIAGKFTGNFPPEVTLVGQSSTGQELRQNMKTLWIEDSKIPVSKVFVKGQLDQLVAEHWLGEDPKVKEEIVNISVNEQLPTPHTTMIAYEMDEKQKEKMEKEEKKNQKKKKKGPSGATIAKYAGGAIALTAGAVLIGSVAMTMSGGSGFGAIGDLGSAGFENIFGGGCCDCCGEIFGGICGDCGCLGDIFGEIGGCCGDVCGEIGGVLGDCSCCGEIVGALGDVCGSLGDVCGEIVGCLSECPIEEVCSGCIELLTSLLDAL